MKKEKIVKEKNANRIPQNFMEAAASFEKSKIEELKFSRKMGWFVGGAGLCIGVISTLAMMVTVLAHKDPEPVILKVDNTTGDTSQLRSVKDAADKYDEVMDKHWLAVYVLAREGYDWYTIGTQFEAVKLMSADDVSSEYENKVKAPNAPLNLFKDKFKVVPKITSISFVGDVAQVRFTTEKQSTSGQNMDGSPVQKWIATVAYKYETGAFMTEQQRYVNPLGFKALSYRSDSEVVK